MTIAASTAALPDRPAPVLADIATITGRNLRRLVRVPTLLVFATLQPVLFVLLFSYAFGGAIHVPGVAPPPPWPPSASRSRRGSRSPGST